MLLHKFAVILKLLIVERTATIQTHVIYTIAREERD